MVHTQISPWSDCNVWCISHYIVPDCGPLTQCVNSGRGSCAPFIPEKPGKARKYTPNIATPDQTAPALLFHKEHVRLVRCSRDQNAKVRTWRIKTDLMPFIRRRVWGVFGPNSPASIKLPAPHTTPWTALPHPASRNHTMILWPWTVSISVWRWGAPLGFWALTAQANQQP